MTGFELQVSGVGGDRSTKCATTTAIPSVINRSLKVNRLNRYSLRCFLNGPTPASFFVYFWSFQTNIFTMSIQYMVLGFEPTIFGR